MSLKTRAFLAIFLMIGFYVLALAVAGGLLWLVYAQWAYFDRVNGRLTIACVVGAAVILWSIVPRRDHFESPGPRIEPEQHPRLFAELNNIAGSLQQEMPHEVYLMADVNAWVAQRGGTMGIGSRRVMALGMPLMALLTVSQFRAVVAHEFGHYYGGDTKLGPWIYKTRSAIGRTLRELARQNSWLVLLFRWYGELFMRVTLAISRAQEYAADRLAAQFAGSKAVVDGLKQVHRGALAWNTYLENEVIPVLSAGFSPPISQGFTHFLKAPGISKPVEDGLQKELLEGKADPLDSHPSLPERIAAVHDISTQSSEDDRPATTLLENYDNADTSLAMATENSLKPMSWEKALLEVYLPGWRTQLSKQAESLRGLKVADLPQALWSGEMRTKIKNPPGTWPTTEERAQMAQSVAACALALLLLQDEWTFHMLPGESYCEKNGILLEPFNLVPKLARKELTDEQWQQIFSQAGILDRLLFAETVSAAAAQ